MNILGVDTGYKNLGVALFNTETDKLSYYSYYSPCSRVDCFNWFKNLLIELSPEGILLEKPFYSFNSPTASLVLEYTGTLKLVAEMANIPYNVVSPRSAKKHFTGSGNADKQVIIDKVEEIFKIHLDNNHVADSIAIAYAGKFISVYPEK